MGKNKRQKAKKIIRDKVILAVGIVGSSVLLIVSAVESFQTYRRNPTPQRILDVKPEIDRSWKNLAESDDLAEKRAIMIDLEKKAREQRLGVTRMASWSLSHLSELEQALSSPDNLSPNELKRLLNSLHYSLWRIVKYSTFQKKSKIETSWVLSWTLSQGDFERYLDGDYSRFLDRDLERNFQDFERNFQDFERNFQDFEGYFEGYFQDFERYFEGYFEWYFERDFERNLLKQLMLVKWSLLQLERGIIPEIPIKDLSEQIISLSKKAYEQELAQSYALKGDREFTANQRQIELITFLSLAFISTIGLNISALLLIRSRNQKITWNTINWCFVPEECIAELEEFYQGLKAEEKAIWTIHLIMLWNILVLLKSLYIQVAIEDLFLPGKNQRD